MSMVQDGHQLQSEIKTPTGNHVLVDYSGGSYGDFLRYFISLHDGFEPIAKDLQVTGPKGRQATTKDNPTFPIYYIPNITQIDFLNVKNIKDFIKKFKIVYPNCNKYRQCYKTLSYQPQLTKIFKGVDDPIIIEPIGTPNWAVAEANRKRNTMHFHSVVGCTWLEDGAIINDKVFKWDYSDYEIIKQTDHKVIFVILNPFSKYKDHYLKRHLIWSSHKKDYDSNIHEASWKRNFIKNNYPKGKLNYELEINDLLDKDDKTYYDLIEFVNVKPLDDWKDHIEEYHKDVLSK